MALQIKASFSCKVINAQETGWRLGVYFDRAARAFGVGIWVIPRIQKLGAQNLQL